MILFPNGITLTPMEHKCLLHMKTSPEQWLIEAIAELARVWQETLITDWRPRLFADSTISELPANPDALVAFIIGRADYQSRAAKDTATGELIEGEQRRKWGERTLGQEIVTLFPNGLNISDLSCNCILAYIQDLDEWIIGALRGQINRGKKKMIAQYHPIIMADPSVTTMPATEDGLITMILERPDYQRLGG